MKAIFITIICTVVSLNSNAQEKAFQGKINGIDSAEIGVLILPLKLGETPLYDTIHCVNGSFGCTVNFNLDMWHLVRLNSKEFNSVFGKEKSSKHKLKNREIVFFIHPKDQLSILANIAEYGIKYQVFGNEINTQRNQVVEKLFPLEEEYNQLDILIDKLESSDQTEEYKDLDDKIQSVSTQISNLELDYIIKNPDWIYSANMLQGFAVDTMTKYFTTLTTDVQNSFFGIHISKNIYAAKIGSSAPEFTLPDDNGNNVSLNNFLGKYIVLDFWGTWCGYCIMGIPRMKEYYSKYQNKIEFISIDCKDSKNSWLKAIVKYDLKWINLYAENGEITDKYGVGGYPTKIIIDKEGKIVFKSIGETNEFYEKMDKLFTDSNR